MSAAWAADTDRNNARLRDALEARLGDGDRLSFSDADLALLARAERAAPPGRGAPAAGGRRPLEGWAPPG